MEFLRCTYCGRLVRETIHRRTSYQVDYYLMRTGTTVETTLHGIEEDDLVFTFRKLVDPAEVFTCSECYRKPEIRRELEEWGETRGKPG